MQKIIFIGTTEFGIPALEVLKRDYNLVAIITQPDKPVGRKKLMSAPATKVWAIAKNIPFLQPTKISESLEEIKQLAPDLIVVAAYGQIIPLPILKIAKFGAINLHTSLLPKYRGASPIQNAILNNDQETGVTIIEMDELMDHGPILAQQNVQIDNNDDYTSLHEKLALTAATLLEQVVPKIFAGNAVATPQNHDDATFVKMITREHAKIDWTKPARQIYKQVKALNPEPGTWTTLDKKSVKIIDVEEARTGRIELPGKIYVEDKHCFVKCGDYSLKLLLVQPEGKNIISGSEYAHGLKNIETKVFV